MNGWRRFRAPRIAALALLPMCVSAIAQTREFAPPTLATTSAAVVSCTQCGTRWPIAPMDAVASPPPPQRMAALRELKFRDNQPLVNRLKRIQAVPLVTVWDSTAATLYVGVNRDGEPGLHYLCVGYKKFFRHIRKYLRAMTTLIENDLPAAMVMQAIDTPLIIARPPRAGGQR